MKTGRPKTTDPRSNINFRLTGQERAFVEELAKKKGLSITEVLREFINKEMIKEK